ncbi:MAG: RlmE family RNA methyltransferase [Deltaproteobacteria bacterium]|nr:RlmE family RNA methyltransferase [Deltaproteobacteria bacterium]
MGKQNRWKDHYTDRAREEKWLARSVYKLEEIDKKHRLIRRGQRLLDLGCYPGSWSQYCIKRVGDRGEVTGIDLKQPDRFSAPNFRFIEADIFHLDTDWLAREVGQRDAVISDLAPQTTGVRVADASRSLDLAERALEIALAVLKKNGHFLCKIFEGEDLKAFRDRSHSYFSQMRLIRPSAVRKRSREVYLLGLNRVKQ